MKWQMFRIYTEISVKHPVEVISVFLVATLGLILANALKSSTPEEVSLYSLRVASLISTCVHFKRLKNLQSKFFIYFCTCSFSLSILGTWILLDKFRIENNKSTLSPLLLLIDSSRIINLCNFVFAEEENKRRNDEVFEKIAQGMAKLGPQMTLDVLLEVLLISMGTLPGLIELNYLSTFACSVKLIDYLIFMALFPPFLTLMVMKNGAIRVKTDAIHGEKQMNSILLRIKLIMCFFMTSLHIYMYIHRTIFNNGSGNSQNHWKCFNLNNLFFGALTAAIVKLLDSMYIDKKETLLKEAKIKENEIVLHNLSQKTKFEDNNDEEEKEQDDEEVLQLMAKTKEPLYNLEKLVKNYERAVKIRRDLLGIRPSLPYKGYEYEKILGTCCENVVGYMTIPVGVAGPLPLDQELIYIPLATTEGCLVASTNRACRALRNCGVTSHIISDGMTRGPVVKFPSLIKASEALEWIRTADNFLLLKREFDSTSNFAQLKHVKPYLAGRILFLRFTAHTGDAMGMNMLTKGTQKCLIYIQDRFPEMEIISVSGNYCNDKKPAAINWVEGRGKSVTCNALVPPDIVKSVLKTSSAQMVKVNLHKNLIGSAVAGSIGGFNAHAANIVTALFIATGQDPAQTVTSSNCLTIMETQDEALYISCTMPSIEVGTVGGGTILSAQSACLDLMGVKGGGDKPGDNAAKLARIVCGAVLAGELSLIAAQAEGKLIESHLKYNRRKKTNSPVL